MAGGSAPPGWLDVLGSVTRITQICVVDRVLRDVFRNSWRYAKLALTQKLFSVLRRPPADPGAPRHSSKFVNLNDVGGHDYDCTLRGDPKRPSKFNTLRPNPPKLEGSDLGIFRKFLFCGAELRYITVLRVLTNA